MQLTVRRTAGGPHEDVTVCCCINHGGHLVFVLSSAWPRDLCCSRQIKFVSYISHSWDVFSAETREHFSVWPIYLRAYFRRWEMLKGSEDKTYFKCARTASNLQVSHGEDLNLKLKESQQELNSQHPVVILLGLGEAGGQSPCWQWTMLTLLCPPYFHFLRATVSSPIPHPLSPMVPTLISWGLAFPDICVPEIRCPLVCTLHLELQFRERLPYLPRFFVAIQRATSLGLPGADNLCLSIWGGGNVGSWLTSPPNVDQTCETSSGL